MKKIKKLVLFLLIFTFSINFIIPNLVVSQNFNMGSDFYVTNNNGKYPKNYEDDGNARNYNGNKISYGSDRYSSIEYDEGWVSKIATPAEKDGEFYINLLIKGKTKKSQIQTVGNLDLCIVLDNSGSMEREKSYYTGESRARIAHDRLKDFLKILEKYNVKNNINIGLVTFGNDVKVSKSLTTNISSIKSAIPSYADDEGTFTQAGIREGYNILSKGKSKNKVLLVVTDGAPTYSYRIRDFGNSNLIKDANRLNYRHRNENYEGKIATEFYNYDKLGNGSDYHESYDVGGNFWSPGLHINNHGFATVSEAKNQQKKYPNIDTYSVGIELNNGGSFESNNNTTVENRETVAKNIATSNDKYFDGNIDKLGESLGKILKKIEEEFNNSIVNGAVTDPMSDNVKFNLGEDGEFNEDDYKLTASYDDLLYYVDVDFDKNSNTLKIKGLDLGEDEWVKLRYKVNLQTEKDGFKGDFYYQTNRETYLEPIGEHNSPRRQFSIPSVKGETIKVDVEKRWENVAEQDKKPVSFQLVRKSNNPNSQEYGKEKLLSVNHLSYPTWKTTINGLLKYDNLGYAYDYKVIEQQAGDYDVSIQNEEFSGKNGNARVIITNSQKRGKIVVKKVDDSVPAIPLNKVQFTLSGTNYNEIKETIGDGTATFENLMPGTYTLRETRGLPGYEQTLKTWSVVVDKKGNVTVREITRSTRSVDLNDVINDVLNVSIRRGNVGQVLVSSENTYEKTKYYDPNNPLGIIGGFHIVGFGKVTTQAHTNGNILANELEYISNFGTNGIDKEVSYIRKLTRPAEGFKSANNSRNSVLVVGTDITVGKFDGNSWTLNGAKVDTPSAADKDSLWQDTDTKFIDIEKAKSEIVAKNVFMSKYTPIFTEGKFEDMNNQKIILSNVGGVNVYNIDASTHPAINNNVSLEGFEQGKITTLIINVDMKGRSDFDINGAMIKYKDGTSAPTGEVTKWQDGNVIWNFYDSTKSDRQFRGNIRNGRTVTGMVIAPNANVDITQNLNGTVVANNVKVSAESHRTDFTGPTIDHPSDPTPKEILVVNKKIVKFDIELKKVDSKHIGLFGAEFELYSSKNTLPSEKIGDTIKSDGMGKLIINGLKKGKYYLKEVKAPNGYLLSNDIIEIEVKGKNSFTINGKNINEIENRVNDIYFTKYKNDHEILPGVKFELYKEDDTGEIMKTIDDTNVSVKKTKDGNGRDHVISERNGIVRFEKLSPGKYYFKEVDAPEGYAMENRLIGPYEITKNGEVIIKENLKKIINNLHDPMFIKIAKKDNKDNLIRVGTLKLKLSGNDIESIEKEYDLSKAYSNENNEKFFKFEIPVNLKTGEYTLEETVAPKGYIKTVKKYIIKVDQKARKITLLKEIKNDVETVKNIVLYSQNVNDLKDIKTIIFEIINNRVSYPKTGGIGIKDYMIFGLIFVAGGLLIKKRLNKKSKQF